MQNIHGDQKPMKKITLDDYNMVSKEIISECHRLLEERETSNEIQDWLEECEGSLMHFIDNVCEDHLEWILENSDTDEEFDKNIYLCMTKMCILGFMIGRKTYLYNPEEDMGHE